MAGAMRSEKEKMLAGELYLAFDNELFEERQRAKQLLHKYNQAWQVAYGNARRLARTTHTHMHSPLHGPPTQASV